MLDASTITTSITINGRKKQVINYYGAPKKLYDLEDKIKRIILPNNPAVGADRLTELPDSLSKALEEKNEKIETVSERISGDLEDVAKKVLEAKENGQNPAQLSTSLYRVDEQGRIQVYIKVTDFSQTILDQLVESRVEIEIVAEDLKIVQGWMPAENLYKIATLEAVSNIKFAEYGYTR